MTAQNDGKGRVIATDPLSEELIDALASIGLTPESPPKGLSPTDLGPLLGEVEVLIVGDSPVAKGALERAPRLGHIARMGAGPGHIDVRVACDRGVLITHAPACDAEARADRLLMLISMLDAGIAQGGASGRGLQSSRLGVVGDGEAASMLARSAIALGVRVRAWSPELTPARAVESGATYVDGLSALADQSDILCLTEPGFEVDSAVVNALPAGAHLVFGAPTKIALTSLTEAMADGKIGVAALHDALPDDCAKFAAGQGATILSAEHLCTARTRSNVALSVMQSVRAYLRHQPAHAALNLAETEASPTILVVRHSTSAEALAGLFSQLKTADLKVSQLDNRVFHGGQSAMTRISLNAPPSPVVLQRLRGITGVIAVDAITP